MLQITSTVLNPGMFPTWTQMHVKSWQDKDQVYSIPSSQFLIPVLFVLTDKQRAQTGKRCAIFQHNPDNLRAREYNTLQNEAKSWTPPWVSWRSISLWLTPNSGTIEDQGTKHESAFRKILHWRWTESIILSIRIWVAKMAGTRMTFLLTPVLTPMIRTRLTLKLTPNYRLVGIWQ